MKPPTTCCFNQNITCFISSTHAPLRPLVEQPAARRGAALHRGGLPAGAAGAGCDAGVLAGTRGRDQRCQKFGTYMEH